MKLSRRSFLTSLIASAVVAVIPRPSNVSAIIEELYPTPKPVDYSQLKAFIKETINPLIRQQFEQIGITPTYSQPEQATVQVLKAIRELKQKQSKCRFS